jgi:hypothetical protein
VFSIINGVGWFRELLAFLLFKKDLSFSRWLERIIWVGLYFGFLSSVRASFLSLPLDLVLDLPFFLFECAPGALT